MASLEDDRYYSALDTEVQRLANAVGQADLSRRVPTCPEWTIAQLTEHVGRAHRWVTALVAQRATSYLPPEEVDDIPLPSTSLECSAWLRSGAFRLLTAIREAGTDTPVWSWADDQRVGFWLRRMVHETAVHRADAELALGGTVMREPDLAADAVTEWLEFVSSPTLVARRPQLAELRGDGQTLHFHATDDGLGEAGEWLVRRTPDGVAWEYGHGKGDVAVRGTAVNVMLLITRRIPPDDPRVEVIGDRELLDHWLEHTSF
ncbi:MAG: maleylpyruvate isomerase family mycothiol-dependent enzyme [Actinomycetota bacterium]|nr:maleylpyruvate isomerase family mycothiol-dependent enzyme [Actinomycetota bacterium]